MRRDPRSGLSRQAWSACAVLAWSVAGPAWAMPIDTGNEDLKLNFDSTLKYSAAWRLKDASPGLLGNPNNDDGDRNFGKGLVSNRVDLLSELDLVYAKRFGFRLSGAAWYDSVYNTDNDNPGFAGGAFPNQVSVPYNQFTDATKKLHGRKAELLDAFVFAKFDLGDKPVSLRLGRHSLLWGESLFLGVNAIAGGMSPVDIVKLASVPNTQFKEAIRPVPQVSGSLQLSGSVSIGAYYQFGWSEHRLPAVGSYFSGVDLLPEGGEQMLLGPGLAAPRLPDQQAKDQGQGGVQLRVRAHETDYGLYLIRFHSKLPQQVVSLGATPFGVLPTAYRWAYHEGITALGASASRTFDTVNVTVEASMRRNQDLASTGSVDASGLAPPGVIAPNDNSGNPAYAVGKTAHVNITALWALPSTALFTESSMAAEVAWNRVLSITKNRAAVDPNATRDAVALRVQFEPMYRQVVGGLDIGVPIGVGYSPGGSRSMALGPAWTPNKGGDVTVGLNGTYLDAWRFSLAYTHYFGREATYITPSNNYSYGQYLKDRDFVALSLRRTF